MNKPIGILGLQALSADIIPTVAMDFEQVRQDMHMGILSDIEDYCFIFGTDGLSLLRDYLARATQDWTDRPDMGRVEKASEG